MMPPHQNAGALILGTWDSVTLRGQGTGGLAEFRTFKWEGGLGLLGWTQSHLGVHIRERGERWSEFENNGSGDQSDIVRAEEQRRLLEAAKGWEQTPLPQPCPLQEPALLTP